MKKILYSFLFFVSALMLGQNNTNTKFAICNDIVGTVEMFKVLKKEITSEVFHKKEKLPLHLKKFSYLAINGLTEIKLKKNYGTPDIIPLDVLNEQYKLPKDTPVIIDGYRFADTSTKIYSEMIKRAEVKLNDEISYLMIFSSEN